MPRKETVEIYKFEELSDSAKKVAIDWYRHSMWEFDDHFISEEILERLQETLKETLPWAPTDDVRFRLSYSQGDGVAFYGPIYIRLFVEKHPEFKPLISEDAACYIQISKSENLHLYDHEQTMELEGRCSMEGPQEEVIERERLLEQAIEVIKNEIQETSRKLRKEGYDIMAFHNSDEVIIENIIANEYEFTANGKRW